MTLPVVFTANGPSGYNLTKSLRFRSSASAYLNRTPASAGNRQKWTWSGWVKRGALSSGSYMDLFTALSGASDFTEVRYHFNANDDTLVFTDIVSGTTYAVYSTNVYRDASAWYHIVCSVDTTQATNTNRVKLYVNGIQVTQNAGGSGYPLQNTNTSINATVEHRHGGIATYGRYFDGYLAEVNFIDGQALTPSSFGETSTTTGVWIPKKYTGTYGTNGFYLPFTDTTSTSTLGTDFSGNSNTWTVNNISLTSGSTYDSMTDVPTLTNATTANYCTLNPVNVSGGGSTITSGNLNTTAGDSGTYGKVLGTFGMTTGKWYWEVTSVAVGTFSLIGIGDGTPATASFALGGYAGEIAYVNNGNKYTNNSSTSYGSSYTTNDVIGVAYDADAGSITFYKNGTSQGAVTGFSGTKYPAVGGYSPTNPQYALNFGQRPFAYTPPTGFVALNTFNLPTPTIGATASTTANKYMNVVTWTGNGTSSGRSITGVGFQPDFVWGKARSVAYGNGLYDAVRGTGKLLVSNNTNSEATNFLYGYLSSFDSDGFSTTAGSSSNENWNQTNDTYVAWNWKANGSGSTNTAGSITSTVSANTTAGFSIVTYTGNGSNSTVGHGLGVAPSMIIIKNRSTVTDWPVYHGSNTTSPATQRVLLNTTDATATSSTYWNNTAPTSSVFSISTYSGVNGNTNAMVAYCFAPIAGYSAFGSYTGNGSTDGTFVFLGFRPRYVMIKRTNTTGDWIVYDSARSTYNGVASEIYPNLSNAEDNSSVDLDFVSNGIKLRNSGSGVNASGDTYIYACFAEFPFKFSNAR